MSPLAQVALLAALATAAIAQGVADFSGAALLGKPLFGFTNGIAERFGAAGLFVAILAHNLGLAALIPGIGYLAARWERTSAGRLLVGRVLLIGLVSAMGAGLFYVLAGPGDFSLGIALPILAGEAFAVLFVAQRAHAQFARFRAAPPDAGALGEAMRQVRVPLLFAFGALAVLAAAEVLVLWT